MTSDNHKLSEEEARAYLNYIKAEDDLTNVANQIKNNTKEIKQGKYKSLSVNANDNNVLNIEKNGKNIYSSISTTLIFLNKRYPFILMIVVTLLILLMERNTIFLLRKKKKKR